MTRIAWSCEARSNLLSTLIGAVALGVLYFDHQPLPVGSDTARAVVIAPAAIIRPQPQKPLVVTIEDEVKEESKPPAATEKPLTPEEKLAADIQDNIDVLERGVDWLNGVPDYTCQFFKQELISGQLLDEQVVFLKIRHEPFSVYMKWLVGDKGREVIYVDGRNDGKMIVHAGGWKARLPALKLDPNGSLAMAESRYPITKAGLLELTRTLLHYRREDLKHQRLSKCETIDGQVFNDRDCCCFVVEYADPQSSPDYRKSVTFVDEEWSVPVCVKNYSWPQEGDPTDPERLDDATLIELYSYSDLQFSQQLADLDFDKKNTEYTFRR